MKQKLFCVLIFLLSTGFVLYAQSQQTLKTIVLTNGISFNGYVESQNSGNYKVTTEDGDVFFYSSSEIASIRDVGSKEKNRPSGNRNTTNTSVSNMKYREYKHLYNPRDYKPSTYDRYNVTTVSVLSWIIPGTGNLMVGDWGTGILCSSLAGASLGLGFGFYNSSGYVTTYTETYNGQTYRGSRYVHDYPVGSLVAGVAGYFIFGMISSVTAKKRAKITNMYYQDMAGIASVQVDLKPMLTFNSTPYSPNNLTPVAGLSLSVKF